jgi:hypothetical protein
VPTAAASGVVDTPRRRKCGWRRRRRPRLASGLGCRSTRSWVVPFWTEPGHGEDWRRLWRQSAAQESGRL